jgi:hypothetical protein
MPPAASDQKMGDGEGVYEALVAFDRKRVWRSLFLLAATVILNQEPTVVCQTKESKEQNRHTRARCMPPRGSVLVAGHQHKTTPPVLTPSTHTHARAYKKHKRKAEEGRRGRELSMYVRMQEEHY